MLRKLRLMLYLFRQKRKKLSPPPENLAEFFARPYRAPDGQMAWSQRDLLAGLDFLAQDHHAVLSLQAWLVLEYAHPGETANAYVMADGKKVYARWQIDPLWDEGAESWEEFAARSRANAREFLLTEDHESKSPPMLRSCVRYAAEFVTRKDYEEG